MKEEINTSSLKSGQKEEIFAMTYHLFTLPSNLPPLCSIKETSFRIQARWFFGIVLQHLPGLLTLWIKSLCSLSHQLVFSFSGLSLTLNLGLIRELVVLPGGWEHHLPVKKFILPAFQEDFPGLLEFIFTSKTVKLCGCGNLLCWYLSKRKSVRHGVFMEISDYILVLAP